MKKEKDKSFSFLGSFPLRKTLSIILAVLMLLSTVPMAAFATIEKAEPADEVVETVEPEENTDEPEEEKVPVSAEVSIGADTYVFGPNEDGQFVLTEIQTADSALMAVDEFADYNKFNYDTLAEIINWKLSHQNSESKNFQAMDGTLNVMFGVSNYNTFVDANSDLICDDCGYCINGCSDGIYVRYTDADIAGIEPDAEGNYYKNGILIASKGKSTFTYETTDEGGNTVEKTEEYTFTQFNSYVKPGTADGKCDVCGKPVCIQGDDSNVDAQVTSHSYADGKCDGCGWCYNEHHYDKNNDGKCDSCGKHMNNKASNKCVDRRGGVAISGKECTVCGTKHCIAHVDIAPRDKYCDICGEHTNHKDEKGTILPDGECDICGNTFCDTHVDIAEIDGICDTCGEVYCVTHTDADTDNICDVCGFCVAACIDADANGLCDVCTKAICADHKDLGNGKCDTCDRCMDGCTDADNDELCDTCGLCVDGCKDETGAQAPDGLCDVCGWCYGVAHVDVDNNNVCDKCNLSICVNDDHKYTDNKCDNCGWCMNNSCADNNHDNKCDNCGNSMIGNPNCVHGDKLGVDTCALCNQPRCTSNHMILADMNEALSWFSGLYAYLLKQCTEEQVTNGEAPTGFNAAAFAELKKHVIAYVPAKGETPAVGDMSGLASQIDMRMELSEGKARDNEIDSFKNSFNSLTAANVTASTLIGKLKVESGVKSVDYTGSLYESISTKQAEYVEAYNSCVYPQSKNYFKYMNSDGTMKTDWQAGCYNKIKDLALDILHSELDAIFADHPTGRFTVDPKKKNEIKVKINAVEEVLLVFLFNDEYAKADYVNAAASIWNGSGSLANYNRNNTWNYVAFAILPHITRALNQLREATFTAFEQTTYDDNGNTYYAEREAIPDDIARDENKDEDDYFVYDKEIQEIINLIDGYASSPECVDLIAPLISDDPNFVQDIDGDGYKDMHDLVMSLLTKLVFNDEIINTVMGLIFPTVIELLEEKLPQIATNLELPGVGNAGNYQLIQYSNNTYTIDATKLLAHYAFASWCPYDWINDLLSGVLVGTSWATVYVNGGGSGLGSWSKSFRQVFAGAGFAMYPDQVADIFAVGSGATNYADAISKLRNAGSWKNGSLYKDGEFHLDFGIDSMEKFFDVIERLLACFNPILEVLFSANSTGRIEIDDIANLDLNLNILWAIMLALKTDVDLYLDLGNLNIYQNVIAPIYEALGVSTFSVEGATDIENYTFTDIVFTKANDQATKFSNAKKAVDGLVNPLLVLIKQIANHPVQKILSILPNIMLFLQNGLVLELLDYNNKIDAKVHLDFNFGIGNYFKTIFDALVNKIMKHWYDWLRPSKYAQFLIYATEYAIAQPLLALLFNTILKEISVKDILNLFTGGGVGGVMGNLGSMMVNGVLNTVDGVVGVFGGKLDKRVDTVNYSDDKYSIASIVNNANIYDILVNFVFTEEITQQLGGADINRISTVIDFFINNIKGEDGEKYYNIDTSLINIDELATLGELKIGTGSVRNYKYYSRFNSISNGQYYYVKADTSDVFYYLIKLVAGLIGDDASLKTILSLAHLKYDDLAAAVSTLGDTLSSTASLELAKIVRDATDENGKLSLDKLIDHLTTNNLLVIIAELLLPKAYALKEMKYKESSKKDEIDAHEGEIPYLEYDNSWTKKFAETLVNDADDVMAQLIELLPIDLDPNKEGLETIQEFVSSLLNGTLDGDILTLLLKQLSTLFGVELNDSIKNTMTMVEKMTGIDMLKWYNDYAYLFIDETEKSNKNFPRLTGAKAGVDEEGNELYKWYLDGNEITGYEGLFAALDYVLAPLDSVLNMILTGEDFTALNYTKKGEPAGHVVTIPGNEGYEYVLLPLLKAILPVNINELVGNDILTVAQFKEKGSSAGLFYSLDLLLDYVMYLLNDSDKMVAELVEMLGQLIYYLASDGLGALVNNIIHPVFVLIDIIRPVLNVDLDELVNELICNFTYKIGDYGTPENMRRVMETRNVTFQLDDLSLEAIMKLASIIVSTVIDGRRYFLDLYTVTHAAIDDISYHRVSVGNNIYKLDTNGADSLTSIISAVLEMALYGDNAKVLDGLLKTDGLVETVVSILVEVVVANYSTDFDWAYILGEDATAEEKFALLKKAKERGGIAAENYRTAQAAKDFNKYLKSYDMTNWDEATADYLADYLNEMIVTVLNIVTDEETGKRLGDSIIESLKLDIQVEGKITLGDILLGFANTVLTDEMVDKIVYMVSDLLANENIAKFKDLIFWADGVLDLDLSVYDIDKEKTTVENGNVVYHRADGSFALKRVQVSEDGSNFASALADILKPLGRLISWLFLGENIEYFNTNGSIAAKGKERRDDLIELIGTEGYNYSIVPLLEMLGCKNLGKASDYINDDYNTDALLDDMLNSIVNRVLDIISDGDPDVALDKVIDLLPNLFYFINSDGLSIAIGNLLTVVNAMLDLYNEHMNKTDFNKSTETTDDDAITISGLLSGVLGTDVDINDLSFNTIFDIVEAVIKIQDKNDESVTYSLKINNFIRRLISNFTIGNIYYNNSSAAENYDTFYMAYSNAEDRAEMITIIISIALDLVEDPDNENALRNALGDEIYETIINVFNLKDFEVKMRDMDWLFTEYAESNTLLSALDLSLMFKEAPYNPLWTRKMAAELADNLEQFIADMLYLLGLEIDGINIKDFKGLMHKFIGGYLFTADLIGKITTALGQIKPLLDKYDPDGYIAGFIKELLNVDVHAWDDYAPGGKYADGRDWGFISESVDETAVDKNSEVFEKALIELLNPVAPLLTWLLCSNDMTFFAEGDGLGNNDNIQLTLCGADGYAYGLVPLFEALNVDGSPKKLAENIRKGNIISPEEYSARAVEDNEYAIYGIIHPLVAKINDVMDDTAEEVLELLPSLIYFVNSNGLDACVRNLVNAGVRILNAIEPIGKQIEMFVYDEQGIDLYKTINIANLVETKVYGGLGITEQDLIDLYSQTGEEFQKVDGLEDINLKLLFNILIAKLNHILEDNGIEFRFTTIAASAIEELTCGYVRGFTSLNGRQAYTMILDRNIDSYCYGDLLTILIRLILKFLSTDQNVDALMHLIQSRAKMDPADYEATYAFLQLLARYMGSPNNLQIAMTSIYYVVYGASKASGAGVVAYDKVNAKWARVINKLVNLNNPIAAEIMKALIGAADDTTTDVVDSNGVAANGLIRFFQRIADFFRRIIEWFKNLF